MLFLVACAAATRVAIDFSSVSIKIASESNTTTLPACMAIWSRDFPAKTIPTEHWSYGDIDEIDWSYFNDALQHEYPQNLVWGFRPLIENEFGFLRRELLTLELHRLFESQETTVVFVANPSTDFAERVGVSESMKLAHVEFGGIVDAVAAARSEVAKTAPAGVGAIVRVEGKNSWVALVRFDGAGHSEELSLQRLEIGSNTVLEKAADWMLNQFVMSGPRRMKMNREAAQRRLVLELETSLPKLEENGTVELFIEELAKSRNFTHTLTHEDIDTAADVVRGKLKDLYKKVVKASDVAPQRIDLFVTEKDAEFVKAILVNAGKGIPVTVHRDEDVAVAALALKEPKDAPVRENVSVVIKGETSLLFNENQKMTETVTIKKELGDLTLFSIEFGKNQLWNVTVKSEKHKSDEVVDLVFGFNEMLAPTLVLAKIGSDHLQFEVTGDWTMSENQTIASRVFVDRMWDIEAKKKANKEAAKDFGVYLEQFREEAKKFEKVMKQSDYDLLMLKIDNMIMWTEEKEDPTIQDIEKKKTKLLKITKDPMARLEEIELGRPAWQNLKDMLIRVEILVREWKPGSSIPQHRIQRLQAFYNLTKTWYDEVAGQDVNPTENPTTSYHDVVVKYEMLLKVYQQATAAQEAHREDEL